MATYGNSSMFYEAEQKRKKENELKQKQKKSEPHKATIMSPEKKTKSRDFIFLNVNI
jgi:hypothetical protein